MTPLAHWNPLEPVEPGSLAQNHWNLGNEAEDPFNHLGAPVHRQNKGTLLFSAVYFSRGTPPAKKGGKRALEHLATI